mmetsp:Transcript_46258/g.89059  ORF Transcript_46258/g.89059 Transcript_46258/m.89059 type:complete len:153 (-) Transcript_46258:132-590(-)
MIGVLYNMHGMDVCAMVTVAELDDHAATATTKPFLRYSCTASFFFVLPATFQHKSSSWPQKRSSELYKHGNLRRDRSGPGPSRSVSWDAPKQTIEKQQAAALKQIRGSKSEASHRAQTCQRPPQVLVRGSNLSKRRLCAGVTVRIPSESTER